MDTTTSRDDFLLRTYSREKLYEPCERSEPRFWDDMKEADDESPRGKGRFFRILGALDHSAGTPDEGGDWTEAGDLLEEECSVTSAQIDYGVEVSSKFLEASKDDGSYTGDAEGEKIINAAKGLFSFADRLLGCGHGTGRLAIVASNSGPSTTVTVGGTIDTPEGVFQLRPNQPIEFVDLDTGGTVQATTRITRINALTHVITVEDNVTVVAGWGIYQSGTYGKAKPNGLRNVVDDGDFAATIFGAARSGANEFLNAIIMDGNGGLQDYSEELVNDLLAQVTQRQDKIPTELRCNQGITDEHKRIMTTQREFMGTAAGLSGNLGVNENRLAFVFGDMKIPFRVDRNLPARELYAIWKPGWRKHTLRKADWMRPKGGGILQLKPADGGGTYAHALVGNMMMDLTISHRRLNANGALKKVRDRTSARDS